MADSERRQADRADALREAARRASPDTEEDDDIDLLADTVAEEVDLGDPAPLDEDPTYDDIYAHDVVALDHTDPEAGRMGVARRVRQVRKAAATPGGRMVTAVPLTLTGITLAIFALTRQTTPFVAAAAIVTPIALVWQYLCFQRWLGAKRYAYRLLESLGEDVSDFTPDQMYRVIKKQRTRTKRRRR